MFLWFIKVNLLIFKFDYFLGFEILILLRVYFSLELGFFFLKQNLGILHSL